jgi:hypothetical protein
MYFGSSAIYTLTYTVIGALFGILAILTKRSLIAGRHDVQQVEKDTTQSIEKTSAKTQISDQNPIAWLLTIVLLLGLVTGLMKGADLIASAMRIEIRVTGRIITVDVIGRTSDFLIVKNEIGTIDWVSLNSVEMLRQIER